MPTRVYLFKSDLSTNLSTNLSTSLSTSLSTDVSTNLSTARVRVCYALRKTSSSQNFGRSPML